MSLTCAFAHASSSSVDPPGILKKQLPPSGTTILVPEGTFSEVRCLCMGISKEVLPGNALSSSFSCRYACVHRLSK